MHADNCTVLLSREYVYNIIVKCYSIVEKLDIPCKSNRININLEKKYIFFEPNINQLVETMLINILMI